DQTLKLFIKSVQSENARIQLFLTEFLDLYKNEYTLKNIVISRKEKMWTLALEILSLFENPNQTMHKLLHFPPELNSNRYNLLFMAYEKGKLRMEALLKQEVYGTEPRNTYGRRDREVNIYTYDQIQELFTQRITKSKVMSSKLNPTPIFEPIKSPVENSIPDLSSSQSNHDNEEGNLPNSRKRKCNFTLSDKFSEKKARRVTKDNEKSILDVFAMKFLSSTPTNSDINEVLSHLDSSWDRENVLQYHGENFKKQSSISSNSQLNASKIMIQERCAQSSSFDIDKGSTNKKSNPSDDSNASISVVQPLNYEESDSNAIEKDSENEAQRLDT
ncbi:3907_t:CDS:2, partial [Racocetra persica]